MAAGQATALVAVVVPYFQRRPGLLRRALESALAQKGAFEMEVLVVDDASPTPAGPELEGLPNRPGRRVRLLSRPNGGAAAARNTALDALPPGATHIAFLDSDDVWTEDHLARALAADADLYFSDFRRDGWAHSAFDSLGYAPASRPAGPDLVELLLPAREEMLLNRPIQTSTVVLRAAAVGGARFPEAWRHAHEDLLFLLELSPRLRRTCLSLREECFCGSGVNIYYAAARPESPDAPGLVRDVLRYIARAREVAEEGGGMSDAVRGHLRDYRGRMLELLAWHLADCAKARRAPDMRALAEILRAEPRTIALLPATAGRLLGRRLSRRVSPPARGVAAAAHRHRPEAG